MIEWTSGDNEGDGNGLGGTPAQVGFNKGDGVNFAAIPASRMADIINIDSTSNVGIPGVWIFRISDEEIDTQYSKHICCSTPLQYNSGDDFEPTFLPF